MGPPAACFSQEHGTTRCVSYGTTPAPKRCSMQPGVSSEEPGQRSAGSWCRLPGRPQMTAQISRAIEYPSGTGPGCGHRGAIRSGSATGSGSGRSGAVQGTPGHPAGVTAGGRYPHAGQYRALVRRGPARRCGRRSGRFPAARRDSQPAGRRAACLPGVGSRPKQLRRTQEPPPPRTPAAVRRWHVARQPGTLSRSAHRSPAAEATPGEVSPHRGQVPLRAPRGQAPRGSPRSG